MSYSLTSALIKNRKALKDLIIIFIVCIIIILSETYFNIHSKIESFAESKGWTLYNEVIMALIALGIAFSLFSFRRLKELGSEIIAHEKTEKDLKTSEAYFRSIFDSANDAIILSEIKTGKIIDVNKKMLELSGYTREEVQNLHMADLGYAVSPYTEEKFLKHMKDVIEKGAQIFEWLAKDSSGNPLWVEISLRNMILNGKGCLLSVVRDITERKRSENFIKNILESVDEGFIIVDSKYRIISANKAYCNQLKMSLEKIQGKYCYAVSHNINKPCFEAGMDCAVKHTYLTGKPGTAIHTHLDTDKNSIYVETKSYPVKDTFGNITSVIEIVHNITDKKRLEEQLFHSQKLEAIGQLAGGVAHDFNNILTAVIGYANMLQKKLNEDNPLRAYTSYILTSSERAVNLTQSLLAFSRKQIINPKPVVLNDIILRVEKLLSRLIGEDIELTTSLTRKKVVIMADSGQIDQVLMNLATNARDAMPDGGILSIGTDVVKLDYEFIKAHGYGDTGMYALISVSDTGTGIDEKIKKKIFEPFFTTKEIGKGTGLGLSIAYGVVKQHNGFINVYSEKGKGTTFKIYIPVVKQEIEEAKLQAIQPPETGTETILLGEDNSDVRNMIRAILEDSGYKVIEAEDGEDAVSKFIENKENIDFLVLDIIMPKKNGKEAYDEIKKIKPDIKVLFTSGYTADIIYKKGIFEEGLNFVPKPVSPNDLLAHIRKIIDKKN